MKTQIKGNMVAITINGVTKEFECDKMAFNVVATKFRTGEKVWPAHLDILKDGRVSVWGGGWSRKGGAKIIVGWFEEGKTYNTRR
jgi:hypothetical protein